MKNTKLIGISATIISATFFGFFPLVTRAIYEGGANTFSTSFFRFFFAILPVYIYLKIKEIDLKITKKELKDITLAALGYGGTTALLFGSYNLIPSGLATTIHFLYPTFTVLGTVIFLKQKVDKTKVLCTALSLIAIFLFYEGEGESNVIGMLLAVISGVTYAFYTIYVGNSDLKKMESLKLIFYMNIISCIVYLIMSLSFGSLTLNVTLT